MSFYWNLSSEDELEGDDEVQDTSLDRSQTVRVALNQEDSSLQEKISASFAAAVARNPSENCSDDDDIVWEDACNNDDLSSVEDDSKPASASSLRSITITMDPTKDRIGGDPEKKRRKRSRKVIRNSSLSSSLAEFLHNLHKAHILALISRAVLLSKVCSDRTILHLAFSLLSLEVKSHTVVPTVEEVKSLCLWYFDFINNVRKRRSLKFVDNLAAGAPRNGLRWGKPPTFQGVKSHFEQSRYHSMGQGDTTPLTLTRICSSMSCVFDENPQLEADACRMTNTDKVQLLVAMVRSLGWRARFVVILDPIRQDLDVDHPLLAVTANVFRTMGQKSKRFKIDDEEKEKSMPKEFEYSKSFLGWVEVLCQGSTNARWMHVDVQHEWIDEPRLVEAQWYAIKKASSLNLNRRLTVAYAIGVEHLEQDDDVICLRLTDVTPRYANSWSKSLRIRSEHCNKWFGETIHILNSVNGIAFKQKKYKHSMKCIGRTAAEAIDVDETMDDSRPSAGGMDETIDADERTDLSANAREETLPSSKADFASHAVYVLSSQLGAREVLMPDAKMRVVGMFKGEPVYLRNDVTTVRVAKKWLYEGRRVRDGEKPIKRMKARKKSRPSGFRQLASYGVGVQNDGSEAFRERQIALGSAPEDDGMEDLFAIWQTDPWTPPFVGPEDRIPVNKYGNIELALLNPGLVHVDQSRIAQVAKKLEIPYAPCLIGFEGHGGNRVPRIRGIVLHQHSVDVVKEAYSEHEHYLEEQEQKERTKRTLERWKKLINGIQLKDRLEREYGDHGRTEAKK